LLSNLLWLQIVLWLCQRQLLTEANAAAAGGLVILFSKQQSYLLGESTPTLQQHSQSLAVLRSCFCASTALLRHLLTSLLLLLQMT
jgi:hypothetical protein